MSIAEAPTRPLVVWRFSDGKRGHDNQSLGLIEALAALRPVERHDLDVSATAPGFGDLLRRRYPPATALPDPHLIVGAGHRTHLPMIAARRARGGRIIVLMRPSLPRWLFDLCVVPRHDGLTAGRGVFVTDGAINRVRPSSDRDPRAALILVGGEAAHVAWNDDDLCTHITGLIGAAPSLVWQIADSRRTPAGLMPRLREMFAGRTNVRCVHWQDVDADWLATQMPRCATIWVTADSISMIYEALSSGASVGLLPVTSRGATRQSRALDELRARGLLRDYGGWCADPRVRNDVVVLGEAQRCARYLHENWLDQQRAGPSDGI